MIDEIAHKRIDSVESRLDVHLDLIEKLQIAIKDNTSSLAENTRLTQEVATNTKDIADLLKGGRVFGKLIIWVASVSGAVAAVWTLIKYIVRGD